MILIILIVLNIILIIAVIFLTLFFIKNKKNNVKDVCVNNDICGEIKKGKHKQETKSERVFVGKIVTDEEYQQMIKNQRNDSISSLMRDIDKEYERLNKLKNEQ